MPERFDRIEPASDPLEPGSRNRGGGAKSRAVNVPDLRSMCGLGIGARSSYVEANGVWGLTAGLKGLGAPRGLSGRLPACMSLNEMGGAKSAALKIMESSVSLAGVGRDARGVGGGRGRRGPGAGSLPLMDDIPRGGIYLLEAMEPLDIWGPWGLLPLRNRGGARGGGVIARRVTGWAKGA